MISSSTSGQARQALNGETGIIVNAVLNQSVICFR